MGFYQQGRNEGNFDTGIERALQRILADPEFVFRKEAEPANLAAGKSYRISDLELASRLSFFLWSSIPDDELIEVASKNKLHEPAVLEQQVRRMLADARSDRLVMNFAGQWLNLRALQTWAPTVSLFPDFDDNLRLAMRKETELFVGSIVHEDRSVTDLLDANYTFLNERLAKHYGIPGVYGSDFRRVELTPEFDMRRGLAGAGQHLNDFVLSAAHHADGPRQNDHADLSGREPARSAAQHSHLEGSRRGGARGREADHAPADGNASQECAVRHLPQDHGPDRILAWRISTPWEPGGPPTTAARSIRRAVLVDGSKLDGVKACARRC